VATSSSAKKVAKLASKGKGKKVRFQGGTVFPLIVAAVVVLGLLTIVYARQSRPTEGSGPPRLGDHWHAAYGMYVCDSWLPKLVGNKEEQAIDPVTGERVLANKNFRLTGIHSHDDGVIHYHPYTSRSTGSRARLGVFLDVYDVKVTDTSFVLPADQGGETYDTKGDVFVGTPCAGKKAQMKVRVWESYANPGSYKDYITDYRSIRIDRNGMVFAIAIVPEGTDVPMPPWADELPQLGAADGGDVIDVPGSTPTGSTPTGSTPTGSTPVTDPAPSDTGVTTTTGG
jgi:hypothetical protein